MSLLLQGLSSPDDAEVMTITNTYSIDFIILGLFAGVSVFLQVRQTTIQVQYIKMLG